MNYLFIISIVFGLTGTNKHTCRWELCPYKGIIQAKVETAVATYTGQMCTDAYYIDMLHIKYPTLDADQLDSLLTINYPTNK